MPRLRAVGRPDAVGHSSIVDIGCARRWQSPTRSGKFSSLRHVTVAEASGTFPFQGKKTGSDNQDLDAARPGTPMDVTFSIGSEVRSSLAELVLLHFPIREGYTFLTPATIGGQRRSCSPALSRGSPGFGPELRMNAGRSRKPPLHQAGTLSRKKLERCAREPSRVAAPGMLPHPISELKEGRAPSCRRVRGCILENV